MATRGKTINRHEIHEYLWENRDRFDQVRIHQKQFADYIGCTSATMCHIIADLTDQGRITKVAAEEKNVGIYRISDPENWSETARSGVRPARTTK